MQAPTIQNGKKPEETVSFAQSTLQEKTHRIRTETSDVQVSLVSHQLLPLGCTEADPMASMAAVNTSTRGVVVLGVPCESRQLRMAELRARRWQLEQLQALLLLSLLVKPKHLHSMRVQWALQARRVT